MNFIKSLVRRVQETSERSTLAKLLWFVGMAYSFLWVPDLDLVFIGILHHRSIVTHSILPAVLMLLLGATRGGCSTCRCNDRIGSAFVVRFALARYWLRANLATCSNKGADWPSDLSVAFYERIGRLLDCEMARHESIHRMGRLQRDARR